LRLSATATAYLPKLHSQYPATVPNFVSRQGLRFSRLAFIKEDESPWVLGAVVNNIWSIGSPPGNSDRTNQLFLNPFFSYHVADGWSVGSSPEIAANWITSGGKWTVPVAGGSGKAFYLGGQAMNLDSNALLQRDTAQSRQRHLAAGGQADLQFPD